VPLEKNSIRIVEDHADGVSLAREELADAMVQLRWPILTK
jgi:hypothetical protein